jgi:hypothetical protein
VSPESRRTPWRTLKARVASVEHPGHEILLVLTYNYLITIGAGCFG